MTFIQSPVQLFNDCKKGWNWNGVGKRLLLVFVCKKTVQILALIRIFLSSLLDCEESFGREKKPCSPCCWRVRCSVILQSAAQCVTARIVSRDWRARRILRDLNVIRLPVSCGRSKGAAAALWKFDFPRKKKKKINKNTTIFASGHSLKNILPQLLLLAVVEVTGILQMRSFLEMFSGFLEIIKEPCHWIPLIN